MNELSPAPKQELAMPAQINVEGLIQMALQNQVPVETIERLTALAQNLRADMAKEAFFRAKAAFQAECPVIKKTRIVRNRDQTPRYQFADLSDIHKQIRPLLQKYELSFSFDSEDETGKCKSVCILSHVAGHSERYTFTSPIDPAPGMNKLQAGASASTYGKRYALLNALGILTGDDDDDGGATSPETEENPQEQAPQPQKVVSEKQLLARIWDATKSEFDENADAVVAWLRKNDLLEKTESLSVSIGRPRLVNILNAVNEAFPPSLI